jgi:hypothetical protein
MSNFKMSLIALEKYYTENISKTTQLDAKATLTGTVPPAKNAGARRSEGQSLWFGRRQLSSESQKSIAPHPTQWPPTPNRR